MKPSLNVQQKACSGLLAVTLVAGCVTLKIDEGTAFAPPKRDVATATQVSELDARLTERLQSGVSEGLWRLEPNGDGATRQIFRDGYKAKYPKRGEPTNLLFRNGFIGEGASRIAWTYYQALPQGNAATARQRPLVVHCAGNAGDRYNSGPSYAQKAAPWGDVFVFDYPGYGDTPGPTNAVAFEGIANRVVAHVKEISANRPLVFWGHSLGGFVCSRLASMLPEADGLILETTAPNASAVARAWTPSYARPFVRTTIVESLASYDVVSASAQVRGPILVLGATKDDVLPVTLARQVNDGLKARGVDVTYHEYPNAQHWDVNRQPNFKENVSVFFKKIEPLP